MAGACLEEATVRDLVNMGYHEYMATRPWHEQVSACVSQYVRSVEDDIARIRRALKAKPLKEELSEHRDKRERLHDVLAVQVRPALDDDGAECGAAQGKEEGDDLRGVCRKALP